MSTRAPKTFDCVQMKWGIQERIERELAGLTSEDRRLAGERRVQDDPILGPFLRSLAASSAPSDPDSPSHTEARQSLLRRAEDSTFRSTTAYPSRDELHERR